MVFSALLVAVLGLPWLRGLMGLALSGVRELALAAALAALCLLWLELVRVLVQYLGSVSRDTRNTG